MDRAQRGVFRDDRARCSPITTEKDFYRYKRKRESQKTHHRI